MKDMSQYNLNLQLAEQLQIQVMDTICFEGHRYPTFFGSILFLPYRPMMEKHFYIRPMRGSGM